MKKKKNSGNVLFEFALYLLLATTLLISQAGETARQLENELQSATGQYLLMMQAAVNKYQSTNDAILKSPSPTIPGIVNPLRPKTSELINAGYLPAGTSVYAPNGLLFAHLLTLVNCPGPTCSVSGVTYSTSGYLYNNSVRSDLLGIAVAKAGNDASQSYSETSTSLTGYANGYVVANPAGAVTGILAIRTGDSTGFNSMLAEFYKLDGSRPLAAAMNVNNNDLNNIKNLTSTGLASLTDASVSGKFNLTSAFNPASPCNAADTGRVANSTSGNGLVICNNNAWQLVGSAVTGIANGVACSQNNALGTDASGIAFVCNGSTWSTLSTYANSGDACAPSGRVATSRSTNEQLMCRNGVFIKMSNLINKNVSIGPHLTVQDGDVIIKPICDIGGTPNYSLALTQAGVDVSTSPPYQSTYVMTVNNGSSWTVLLRLKKANSDGGAEVSGSAYGLSASMTLECTY